MSAERHIRSRSQACIAWRPSMYSVTSPSSVTSSTRAFTFDSISRRGKANLAKFWVRLF